MAVQVGGRTSSEHSFRATSKSPAGCTADARNFYISLLLMLEPDIRHANRGDLAGILSLYRQLNPDDQVIDPAAAEEA